MFKLQRLAHSLGAGLACAAALTVTASSSHAAFAIGHTSRTFIDASRGNRSVATEIYYPAAVAGEDVPVGDGSGERFPVVAFGHGFVMAWSAYENIWEGLVPEGYIVAFPRTEGSFSPSHEQFGRDIAFVANALAAEGANGASIFFDRVSGRAAAMGHSMGGGASVLAASYDATIDAVANLAAAETNPSAIAAAALVTRPSLVISGANDCVTPPAQHQQPIYDALESACKTFVSIAGASHCQFAESNVFCNIGEGSCSPPPAISRAQQHALTMTLLLPWLDTFLRNEPDAWIAFQDVLAQSPEFASQQACAAVGVEIANVGEHRDEIGSSSVGLLVAPNPTSGALRVTFDVPHDVACDICVFDAQGRLVRELARGVEGLRNRTTANGVGLAGPMQDARVASWDGCDASGRRVANGVYFVRLRSALGSQTARAVVAR